MLHTRARKEPSLWGNGTNRMRQIRWHVNPMSGFGFANQTNNDAGCRTCKRRKIKCDEGQPTCERCQRAKRDCEGYVAEHRFVDETIRTERHAKRKLLPRTPQSEPQFQQDTVVLFKSKSSPGSALGLQAFENNIFISFLFSNFFLGVPITTPWPHLHAEDDASTSEKLSLYALATMYFGQTHHQRHITLRGQTLYGQALISLNHDLEEAQIGLHLSLVISAMVLELYELVAFSSSSGWLKHAGGVGRLLELRGPFRHQSPQGRRILEASRLVIILESLVKRRCCFLSSSEWKTIPWALDPKSKTSISYLHDILCDIPGLMEDTDTIRLHNLASEDLLTRLPLVLQNLRSLWTELYKWRVSWQIQNPDSSWLAPSTMEQSPFRVVLHFSSLIHANEITLYNAILLLLIRMESQIMGLPVDPLPSPLALPQDINYDPHIPPRLALNIQAVANEICKSVEYHLHEERRRGGAFFLLFPLRLAWQTFEPDSIEAIWIKDIMEMIADSTGIEMSRGLTRDLIVQSPI